MAEIRRYEQNGEAWEVRPSVYTRYAGRPCVQFDMRGNPETFFGDSVEIIEVVDLGDDWTRYWYMPNDPDLREGYTRLVKLYEYGRARGWNR